MTNKMHSLPTELPLMLPIKKILQECIDTKTFFFEHKLDFKPGQFMMVWIPRLDEKPFTVSYVDDQVFGVSVQQKGEFTTRLFEMKEGEKVGFRGPYGNGFPIFKDKKTCVIGGGCGSAPVAPLIDALDDPYVIIGARSEDNIMFRDRFSKAEFMTDDGSFGDKGFTTDALRKLIDTDKPDVVYACGPEIMIVKVLEVCEEYGLECYVSLERYMKCGFGVCGQCTCGKKRVCAEGPVFSGEEIKEMDDFGKYARTKTGKKVTLKEYYEGH